jgi:hypothetical protein
MGLRSWDGLELVPVGGASMRQGKGGKKGSGRERIGHHLSFGKGGEELWAEGRRRRIWQAKRTEEAIGARASRESGHLRRILRDDDDTGGGGACV